MDRKNIIRFIEDCYEYGTVEFRDRICGRKIYFTNKGITVIVRTKKEIPELLIELKKTI